MYSNDLYSFRLKASLQMFGLGLSCLDIYNHVLQYLNMDMYILTYRYAPHYFAISQIVQPYASPGSTVTVRCVLCTPFLACLLQPLAYRAARCCREGWFTIVMDNCTSVPFRWDFFSLMKPWPLIS